ncbi:hopene-associated glycosyltransferase HpnB [Rubidibacter lacunae KORDI 51-2]|uniref:Hopene-associated glycosyltransferase HpnB n=1 Tax=Rubidibacter lacunae KORDI 51-2 TaxID=582515 RepID=U5DQ09_9CHRO|nr:glycosyltransferase [Rubidibacter lacunae]ERN41785.1 hopene-associated glycosyltransferase HpnB [Rubidibacter lacunae KORDI 51-2]
MAIAGVTIVGLALASWLVLVVVLGQFWRADQRLEAIVSPTYPSVCAVVPARNEAVLLPTTLRSLLSQDYAGSFRIVLVDDQSTDGTGTIAQQTAEQLHFTERLDAIASQPLPAGWTGKLWAMEQGRRFVAERYPETEWLLLTDADIQHDPLNLQQLVAKAVGDRRDLVSLMVLLRSETAWERWLIPAFVYFFMQLYPFRWANDPQRSLAAAAGGCILIRCAALEEIGGFAAVRTALIDDCALAAAVKGRGRRIWLGLTQHTMSLRSYPSLASIWDMVARTAYAQLRYSPLLLVLTVLGMTLVYLVPPLGTLWGVARGEWLVAALSAIAWLLMAATYLPTLKFYERSRLWSLGLPAIAALYTAMTVDSAWRHWRGRGGRWKGRAYAQVP